MGKGFLFAPKQRGKQDLSSSLVSGPACDRAVTTGLGWRVGCAKECMSSGLCVDSCILLVTLMLPAVLVVCMHISKRGTTDWREKEGECNVWSFHLCCTSPIKARGISHSVGQWRPPTAPAHHQGTATASTLATTATTPTGRCPATPRWIQHPSTHSQETTVLWVPLCH